MRAVAGRKQERACDVRDVLDARPVRARDHVADGDGLVSILVPRFNGRILTRVLVPLLREPCFRVRLDRVGSFVWSACDGSRTGREIAGLLAVEFPDMERAEDRLAVFLAHLLAQGHVRDAGEQGP